MTQNFTFAGDITGATVSATYQDVAEWVPSVQKLQAGTVVVLDAGRNNHVVASASAYDTSVAGVISAEPGIILGVPGDDKVKVATTGRVRVKVDATRGAIRVGDLLVTSDVVGVAMRSVRWTWAAWRSTARARSSARRWNLLRRARERYSSSSASSK